MDGSKQGDEHNANAGMGDIEAPSLELLRLQPGTVWLGQAFTDMELAQAGMRRTTVFPEGGHLGEVGAGVDLPNVPGAVREGLLTRAFGPLPVIELVGKIGSIFSERLAPIGEPFGKFAEDVAAIASSFDRLPAQLREALIAMNQCGWYLDLEMDMPQLLRFKEALEEGREKDGESEMVRHFDGRIDNIRAELIQSYPHRREILDAAFDAHLNGQHLVSIPVLLAQVDGICFDVVNAHFFMGKDRSRVVAYATELAGTELARAFLAPLESGMTVALSQKSRPEGFNGLNRHMVLHGESIDYGTKENGLRAISLLNYISQSLQRELSAPDEPETKSA